MESRGDVASFPLLGLISEGGPPRTVDDDFDGTILFRDIFTSLIIIISLSLFGLNSL